MKIREFEGAVCGDCPKVRISIPEAQENTVLGKSVNTGVREEIIELLDFAQNKNAVDIPGAIDAFTEGFRNLQEEFPEELTGWEASVAGTRSYEDPSLLTIKLETYIFTGGAHGYGATRYLNFDKKTRGRTIRDRTPERSGSVFRICRAGIPGKIRHPGRSSDKQHRVYV